MAYAFLNQSYIDSSDSNLVQLIERTLTEIVIPEGVKQIGAHVFAYHYPLKKVKFPESLEILSSNAFSWTALTELDLPIGCKTLESYALYSCNEKGLERIRFGDTVRIGLSALALNRKCLIYDFSRNTAVPSLDNTNAFNGINANAKILVPAALYEEWTQATNWTEYASYIVPTAVLPVIEIPENASEGLFIENGVLKGRGSCTDSVIVVPDDVTGTAWQLFSGDNQIDTLILPEKGIEIGGYLGENSTLRVLINYYYMSTSVGLSATNHLEFISVIGNRDINNYQFTGLPTGIKYDFSRCESVPVLSSVYYITVGEGTLIYVPLELYDEWINATNWLDLAEYIVVAR